MVMFHHEIPYADAYQRGKLQQQVLEDLSAGLEGLEQVDWERAARLVQMRLPPL
jgi:kynurenine 3-monooxygenase